MNRSWKACFTKSIKSFVCCLLLASFAASAATLKDSESASHDDTAALQTVLKDYTFEGVTVLQFKLGVLSHYSYMLTSGSEALVIDPSRDIDAYLETAKKRGWTIKGVFLSHSHADFVAGHLELVKAVNCPIYQSKSSGAHYPITGISHEQRLPWGATTLLFLSTPGHTPDGLSMAVIPEKAKDPKMLFSGDTLFVGSIGRPDLMGGTLSAAELASMAFHSWWNVLAKLPDDVIVLPAHGAGSLCGAHLRDEPFTTIGTERKTNPYLQHTTRSAFISAVLDGLPEAPQYFKHNAKMNREGPPLVDWKANVPFIPAQDASLTNMSAGYVVDLRPGAAYAAGHIPYSVNIGVRGRFESWVGTMIPWGTRMVLCGTAQETAEAATRLHRVGYTCAGSLAYTDWVAAKKPVTVNDPIQPLKLYQQMQAGTAPLIVDVRLPNEWMGLRIGEIINLPLTHLAELASSKLNPQEPVITVCNSAYRSSMGIGILEREGFTKVASMEGGGEAWLKAGLPVIQAQSPGGHAQTTAAKRLVKLPDRIDSPALKRLLLDQPGTFDLVDIRPADMFADYHLPGAQNVHLADLVSDPAFLTGGGPLIIVDRDGSLGMAVGGILSQKTERTIKVLFGGLSAYWDADIPAGRTTPSQTPALSPTAPAKGTTPAPQAKPKTQSAGC